MVEWINPVNGEDVIASINSCLAPLYTMDGMSISFILNNYLY